jgi:hypothetical protein
MQKNNQLSNYLATRPKRFYICTKFFIVTKQCINVVRIQQDLHKITANLVLPLELIHAYHCNQNNTKMRFLWSMHTMSSVLLPMWNHHTTYPNVQHPSFHAIRTKHFGGQNKNIKVQSHKKNMFIMYSLSTIVFTWANKPESVFHKFW